MSRYIDTNRMNKSLARYFTKLLCDDNENAYGGMGLPSMVYEQVEQALISGDFDKIERFIKVWKGAEQ